MCVLDGEKGVPRDIVVINAAVALIAGDVTKAVLAALVARGITPKAGYNRETDGDRWARWRLP